jgi:hypothetical protein
VVRAADGDAAVLFDNRERHPTPACGIPIADPGTGIVNIASFSAEHVARSLPRLLIEHVSRLVRRSAPRPNRGVSGGYAVRSVGRLL